MDHPHPIPNPQSLIPAPCPMTVIYAAIVAAGLVWLTAYAVRGSLLAGCTVVLITAACFGHEFWSLHLGPAPLTLDRLALLLVCVAYVVQRRAGRTDPEQDRWRRLFVFARLGCPGFRLASDLR